MTLNEEIDKKRREIRTDGYPLSIGEWISMYEKNELDIHPEFQRFYRWSDHQKSSLIESILLGIPLPQIFVSQRKDGVWDVIDGLQRLSTIFQFVGILKDEKNKIIPPLKLKGTKYLPALEGVMWNGDIDKHTLSSDLQLVIKRTKISSSIVLKESDETAKYDLFQRLNTGGSELSPQEVRNCLLVMTNQSLFKWLKSLPTDECFKSTTALSDRSLEEAYDVELALRFVILSLVDISHIRSVGDVGVFLTDNMLEIAKNKKINKVKISKLFENTFSLLDRILGDDSFKRFNSIKQRHEGGFLLSLYEVIALGIAFNISNNTLCDKDQIPEKVKSLWTNKEFTNFSTSGVNASRRLPKLIPLGRELFHKS